MPTILLRLAGDAGVVQTADGKMTLTPDVFTGIGEELGQGPSSVWLDAEYRLEGGRLPPTAITAEVIYLDGSVVIASAAHGVCAAIVKRTPGVRQPLMRCRDAAERIVYWPRADYRVLSAVTDAEQRCPACGGSEFDACGYAGSMGEREPLQRAVVCRVCGYAEPQHAIMRINDSSRRPGSGAEPVVHEELPIPTVAFPVYVVEGWPAHFHGQSSRDGRVTGITVRHSPAGATGDIRVEVTSSRMKRLKGEISVLKKAFGPWVWACTAVDNVRSGGVQRAADISDEAATLELAQVRRRIHLLSQSVEPRVSSLVLNGQAEEFTIMASSSRVWVGTKHYGDVNITVAARGVEPAEFNLVCV